MLEVTTQEIVPRTLRKLRNYTSSNSPVFDHLPVAQDEIFVGAATGKLPDNRILLVEDSLADLWLLERAIRSVSRPPGFSYARDGVEAIDHLAGIGVYGDRTSYPLPSLVLLDVNLPTLSGLDVLRWIRNSRGPIRELPVVMLSGVLDRCEVERAYRLGINAWIVKPASPREFAQLMEKVFRFLLWR